MYLGVESSVTNLLRPLLHAHTQLVAKLKAAAANPVNPSFNHYMFETIAALVKNVCSVHSDALPAFDSTLCPLVRDILDQDVVEFGPYGFQLLAQLLDLHRVTGAPIPPDYLAILPPLFMPVFWERPGYVPALTPLIVGYMYTAAADIVSKGQVRDIVALRIFAPASTSICSLICLPIFLSSQFAV